MAQSWAKIAGVGNGVPERVMPNSELERLVATSDAWIRARTGIHERRIAAPEETTSLFATLAGRAALARASLSPEDLDLIIVATCTPNYASTPSTASLVQHALGASRAGAFDLNAACSGFVYALGTGSQFILSGAFTTVLVIGADVFIRILDWQDRATCVLFGDAAGAVVLRATDEPGGPLSFVLGSDGAGACHLYVPAGGSRLPTSHETVAQRLHSVRMHGHEVFRFATTVVPDSVLLALEQVGLTPRDVDRLLPHQANRRIIEAQARRLNLSNTATFSNVERYGNTSAASVPLALCDAVEQGRITPGDTIVMAVFGAGLSWATAVWRWHFSVPRVASSGERAARRNSASLAKRGPMTSRPPAYATEAGVGTCPCAASCASSTNSVSIMSLISWLTIILPSASMSKLMPKSLRLISPSAL